ncbi:hypothetical protein Tco_1215485 [Tanacetum coccineum]
MTHPHPNIRFVPQAVLTRSGKINTAGVSVNTAVRPVNIADSKPTVNHPRTILNSYKKGYSQVTRPFNKYSANKNSIFNKKVNTVRVKDTSARDRAVVNENKGKGVNAGNPRQKEYKEKGVIDSGCSRHMTRNKGYLTKYEDYDGGFVSFGDAEYVAAANCCGHVLWIQNQMLDYGFNFMFTKIYIDNESTIFIVKNPMFHSKTKHIEIRHHFIRDSYEKKLLQVIKIHTDHNVADLLTKAFDVSSCKVNTARQKISAARQKLVLLSQNETVYKEWEDRMERAATTASSLDAEQDSGSGPRTVFGKLALQAHLESGKKIGNKFSLLSVPKPVGLVYYSALGWLKRFENPNKRNFFPFTSSNKDKGKAVKARVLRPTKKINKRVLNTMKQKQRELDYEAAMSNTRRTGLIKRQRMAQVHHAAQVFTYAEWDDILLEFLPVFEICTRILDMNDLVKLWSLVHERFELNKHTDDKSKRIVVEPEEREGHDIFMLVETRLSTDKRLLMTLMLCNKIRVDNIQIWQMSFLSENIILANRTKTVRGVWKHPHSSEMFNSRNFDDLGELNDFCVKISTDEEVNAFGDIHLEKGRGGTHSLEASILDNQWEGSRLHTLGTDQSGGGGLGCHAWIGIEIGGQRDHTSSGLIHPAAPSNH